MGIFTELYEAKYKGKKYKAGKWTYKKEPDRNLWRKVGAGLVTFYIFKGKLHLEKDTNVRGWVHVFYAPSGKEWRVRGTIKEYEKGTHKKNSDVVAYEKSKIKDSSMVGAHTKKAKEMVLRIFHQKGLYKGKI